MPKKQPRYDIDVQRRAVEQVLVQRRPIAQVARKLHCSAQSVQRWIKQHRQSLTTPNTVPSTTTAVRTTFLPIQVDRPPSSPSAPIELVTKNGLTLRFPVDTPSDILCDFVQRLEGVPC